MLISFFILSILSDMVLRVKIYEWRNVVYLKLVVYENRMLILLIYVHIGFNCYKTKMIC